ncbi:hypothetical protein ACLEPN_35430 [Myxococcus sp. 1LA]
MKAHYTCLIDTTAEDTLTLSGTAQFGDSAGTAYDATGCRMYTVDLNVRPAPAGTTYTLRPHTSVLGLKGANCTNTELYTDLYKWSASTGRYHRVGGLSAKGALISNGNVCRVALDPAYPALTIQAPASGTAVDSYRAVSWARFYGTPSSCSPLPVRLDALVP